MITIESMTGMAAGIIVGATLTIIVALGTKLLGIW